MGRALQNFELQHTTPVDASNLRPLQPTVPWGLILILWRQRSIMEHGRTPDAILIMTSPACLLCGCGPSAIEIANLSRSFNFFDSHSEHLLQGRSMLYQQLHSSGSDCPGGRQPVNIQAGRRQSPDRTTDRPSLPPSPQCSAADTGCRDRSVAIPGPLTAADASWHSTHCSHHPAGRDQFRILVVLQMAENEFVAEFFNG